MTKVAIISGSGRLPLLIGENLIKKKYDVFFICLKNNANSSDYKKYKYCLSSITSFTKILNILKKQKNIFYNNGRQHKQTFCERYKI